MSLVAEEMVRDLLQANQGALKGWLDQPSPFGRVPYSIDRISQILEDQYGFSHEEAEAIVDKVLLERQGEKVMNGIDVEEQMPEIYSKRIDRIFSLQEIETMIEALNKYINSVTDYRTTSALPAWGQKAAMEETDKALKLMLFWEENLPPEEDDA